MYRTGRILARCHHRHRHQEYLDFLKIIEANVPSYLNIHPVVDNYATHKHPNVKNWPAAHFRYQIHYTSTYASWLNQVEILFNLITQRVIRRGTYKNVKDLLSKIDQLVKGQNSNTRPFVWTATADSILEKIKRLCQLISGTQHEALMYPLVSVGAPAEKTGRPSCVIKGHASQFPRC
jgi:putative transposase